MAASPADPPAEPPRDRMTTLILCLFFGSFGVHSFFTGHTRTGVLQLLTMGGCGIWWAVDLVRIARGSFLDAQGRALIG